MKECAFSACNGFQLTTLKDKMERIVFLFNDGTLRAIVSSEITQSRFQIEMDGSICFFRNVNRYYLNSETMSWTNKEPGMEETFFLEPVEEFISFKSTNEKYLTVTSDGILKFESAVVNDDTIFYISRHCSKGNQYKVIIS